MKKLRLVATLAAFALVASGCSNGKAAETKNGLHVVHVGQVALPIFAPLYVADAKGYFKDAGIKVDLQSVKSGSDAVPLASSGKLDVVVAGFSAGLFSAINSGLDVKVVGSMGVADGNKKKSPTDLVVSKKLVKSGAVKSVADLKGKKIACAGGTGGTGAYLLGLALKKVGLTINDVKVVNLGNPDMPTAIKNGSVAAGLVSAPFSQNAIKDGTGVSMAVPPKGTSGTGVIYGSKFADSTYAQKFFTAMAKGAKDLQGSHRYDKDNVKIIADATSQKPAAVKALPLYTWLPNLAPLPGQLTGMEKFWMKAGSITYTKPLNPSKYIDKTFANKAK